MKFDKRAKRTIAVFGTAILFILALVLLLVQGGGTPIQRCSGILLGQQKNTCFAALASSTNNASVCNYISGSDTKNSCIVGIAETTSNVSVCSYINSTNPFFDNCISNLSIITKTATYCQLLNDPYESQCSFAFARNENFSRSADCSLVYNSTQKGICNYAYDFNTAVSKKTSSYCSLLPSTRNATLTTYIFTQNSKVNSSVFFSQLFLYGQLNITPQNYCYYKVATTSLNRSACSLTSGLLTQLCNATITQSANTTKITNATVTCASAPSYLKSVCVNTFLSSQALSNKNFSACLQINSQQYQYTCIINYAVRYNSSSYCGYIKNSTVQQSCYLTTVYRNTTRGK